MAEKEIINYIRTLITSEELIRAFTKVDRRKFLPDKLKDRAYSIKHIDEPLQITKNYTTTALSLGLKMLDLLELKKEDKVLEIGTGIGYYTALIAEIVGGKNVYTVEYDEEMFNIAKQNLKEYNVNLIFGDGSIGYEEAKPYDKAIIWAASPTFPCLIYNQIKDQGIIIVPITDKKDRQGLYKIVKVKSPTMIRYFDVIFSPLRGICGYWLN
ncbi:protein-L-isoaspartate O-methyltransferase family protein [Sulfurisphaera tokodaii]|uniref:protein-L-isoaspartate(D-aspartate) O-methyltransferase n=2 Tax=Sulfurisphaera tokodaii TaxID=111955 RepID=Q976K8_SULTO|nr:protein-L-isoaspartate O-methyltransferase [Sulfurisphaera tokodaii]BAB65139.1 protein-L-isoaspartate O-methyltransferase [Sulfurisphaera tokodaii str. 7]HII74298.1 protein-L-isoaspartate O-methyltransferase [Sulfurisphaera tokodaii]